MIDFRSDTMTKPTPDMLKAMMSASVGDDVYDEDPSVNELQEFVADLLGKEAGLFVPSGTMANQLAIFLHTRPGDSVITEDGSHTFAYEAGAAAANSGVQFSLIPRECLWDPQVLENAYRPVNVHFSPSKLLVVENTHNRGGGRALTLPQLERPVAFASAKGLRLHCDGARIWNAAKVVGVTEKELAGPFDSIAACFSKGLGAPVGSILCGPKPFIADARRQRRRWGGGMRQAGFLAAAALFGIKHHRDRLEEDHGRCRALAMKLQELAGDALQVYYPEQGSNMVLFRFLGVNPDDALARLEADGLLVNHMGESWLRIVGSLVNEEDDYRKAFDIIRKALS